MTDVLTVEAEGEAVIVTIRHRWTFCYTGRKFQKVDENRGYETVEQRFYECAIENHEGFEKLVVTNERGRSATFDLDGKRGKCNLAALTREAVERL